MDDTGAGDGVGEGRGMRERGDTDAEDGMDRGPGDARFEAFLRDAAAEYNRPPAVPRERMWARIEEGRRAGAGSDLPEAWAAPAATRSASKRRAAALVPPWAWGLGVAALLALGIGIGRISVDETGTGADPVELAESPDGVPEAGPVAGGERADGADVPAGSGAAPATPQARDDVGARREGARMEGAGMEGAPMEGAPIEGARMADAGAGRDAVAPADAPAESGEARANPGRGSAEAPGAVYRHVAAEHLGQAEALLTTFRLEARDGTASPEVGAWADALLSDTRLLLDSRAGRDPRLRNLLEQMELVLAEISALGGEGEPEERERILRSVENDNLLLRLRTAAEVRPPEGGANHQRTSL